MLKNSFFVRILCIHLTQFYLWGAGADMSRMNFVDYYYKEQVPLTKWLPILGGILVRQTQQKTWQQREHVIKLHPPFFYKTKHKKMNITPEKSWNDWIYTSALDCCSNNYLYFSEAVWTEFGVDCHPARTQKTVQSFSQNCDAVPALQQAFPRFTPTHVVFPQSLHPLWDTQTWNSVLNFSTYNICI